MGLDPPGIARQHRADAVADLPDRRAGRAGGDPFAEDWPVHARPADADPSGIPGVADCHVVGNANGRCRPGARQGLDQLHCRQPQCLTPDRDHNVVERK